MPMKIGTTVSSKLSADVRSADIGDINMISGSEALTVLRENGKYLDKNFIEMSDGAIGVRLREMEEAIEVIKHLMRIK